ncbi:uncharacterized protein LOC129872518 [Solanum dulcamara]|uniref:uncharacterized protein LOC129872518 n=1 Tax=Solanum dulcamara TaxID=45834 RepID=UPI002485ABB9|nr:uncharacterized protein LOC129872518 [Solanum dulcamara]
MVMGDFNSILRPEDRLVGSQVQGEETRDFRNFLNECNLSELPTFGRQFIWTNGYMYSRIDRALVNVEWIVQMPSMQVIVMAIDALFSDHSPLSIVMEEQRDSKKKLFRFYNCLAQHPELKSKIQDSWQTQREE